MTSEKSLVEVGGDFAEARRRRFEYREEPMPQCPHGVPCLCRSCGEPTQDDVVESMTMEINGHVFRTTARLHYCVHCGGGWGGCIVEHPVNDDDAEFWQDIEDVQDLRALDG